MMQLDSLSGGVSAASDVASINSVAPKSQTSRLLDQPETSPLSTHNISSGFTSVINWLPNYIVKHRALETSTVSGENDQTSEDEDYRPFTPPPPRERLSYTRYQLALLNGIYQEVRYPNGTQKQLIAKRVGITREQVKIWFQNRRRKDVVTKVVKSKSSKSENLSEATGSLAVPSPDIQTVIDNSFEGFSTLGDDSANQTSQNTPCDTQQENELCDTKHQNKVGEDTTETSPGNNGSYQQSDSTSVSQIVSPIVLRSMIVELNKFNNEYLKLKKSKKKKKKSKGIKPAPLVSAPTKLSSLPSFSSLSSCQAPRLFQSYDMVAPPNKLTPTANTTLHASETSAFRNPRNQSSSSSTLWDHLNSADFLQPYCSLESLHSPDLSHNCISTSSAGSAPSNSLSQTTLHQQTLHLDSSLELQSPSMTARLDHVISANRQFHTVMAPQAAPSSSHLLHRQDLGFSSSAMMSDSNNVFQPSPTVPQSLSLQRHHTSHFPSINRVYPFPLVAEPPIMLSNISQPSVMLSNISQPSVMLSRISQPSVMLSSISQPSVMLSSISQNESYLQNAAWHSISAQTTAPPGPLLPEDSYRPLLISSLNNPYFSPTTHSSSHSPTPATTRWPLSQTLTSDLNNNQFTQL